MYRKLFFWNRENRMNRSITIRRGEMYLKIEKLWLVSPFPLWQIFNFLLKTNYVRRANDGDWQPMSNGKVKMRRHTVTEEGGAWAQVFWNRVIVGFCKQWSTNFFLPKQIILHWGLLKVYICTQSWYWSRIYYALCCDPVNCFHHQEGRTDRQMYADCAWNCYLALVGEELLSLLILDLIFYLFPLSRIVYALHSHSHASFHLLIVYTHHDIWFPHWQQNYIYIQISNISILFMISVVSLFTLSSLCDAGKKSHYFLPRKFTSEADCADKYSKFISDVLRFSLS